MRLQVTLQPTKHAKQVIEYRRSMLSLLLLMCKATTANVSSKSCFLKSPQAAGATLERQASGERHVFGSICVSRGETWSNAERMRKKRETRRRFHVSCHLFCSALCHTATASTSDRSCIRSNLLFLTR